MSTSASGIQFPDSFVHSTNRFQYRKFVSDYNILALMHFCMFSEAFNSLPRYKIPSNLRSKFKSSIFLRGSIRLDRAALRNSIEKCSMISIFSVFALKLAKQKCFVLQTTMESKWKVTAKMLKSFIHRNTQTLHDLPDVIPSFTFL